MPTQNVFQQARTGETSQPIQAIPLDLDDVINYSRASLKGINAGLYNLINMANDPWGKVIDPTFTLLYDSAVIYAAHSNHNNMAAPDGYIPFYNYVLQNQPAYLKAIERMEARINGFKDMENHFVNGDGPHRAEMIAEGVTGIFAPGFIFKGISASAAMARNIQNFGTVSKPPLFHNTKHELTLQKPVFDTLSVKQVKETLGQNTFLFVYTVDKELLVAERRLKKPVLRDGYESSFLHHHELAPGKPVYFAGELETYDGFIRKILPQSGHFLPEGSHLASFMEKTFYQQGYLEAYGTFTPVPLLAKSKNNPKITQEKINLTPGKETMATAFTTATRQVNDDSLKSINDKTQKHTKSNSARNDDLSEHVRSKIADATNYDDLSNRFDKSTRDTIKETGSTADQNFLHDLENIETYQQQYQERLKKEMAFARKIELINTFQDASFAFGQAGELATRLGNPDLGCTLNFMGGAAQFAAGTMMVSLNPLAGIGMVLSGINDIGNVLGEPEEDNRFPLLFHGIQQILQDLHDIKLYLIQANKDMYAFHIRTLNSLFNELMAMQQQYKDQGHKQNFNDAITHGGINLLIEQHQKNTLTQAATYGKGRPLTLAALTSEKYYGLMPQLYQLTEEAFAHYHNGLTVYKAELVDGTKAAIAEIGTLSSKGKMYGYLAAQFDDLRAEAHNACNLNIWLAASQHYLRLAQSKHAYDLDGTEISKIIAQGERCLSVIEKIDAQFPTLFSKYYAEAINAINEMQKLLVYPEKVLELVENKNNFWAITKPANPLIIGPDPNNIINCFHDYPNKRRFPFDDAPLQLPFFIDKNSLDFSSCIIDKEYYGLEHIGMGQFQIRWKADADNKPCNFAPCPAINFKFTDGTTAIMWERLTIDGFIINDPRGYYWRGGTYKRDVSSYVPKANETLIKYRQEAVQEKETFIKKNVRTWENKLVFNLIKAREACLALGINTTVCHSIPTFTMDESALLAPYGNDLRQGMKYNDKLPTHSSLSSDLDAFKTLLSKSADELTKQFKLSRLVSEQLPITRKSFIQTMLSNDAKYKDDIHTSYYILGYDGESLTYDNKTVYHFDKESDVFVTLPVNPINFSTISLFIDLVNRTALSSEQLNNITVLTGHTLINHTPHPMVTMIGRTLRQLKEHLQEKLSRPKSSQKEEPKTTPSAAETTPSFDFSAMMAILQKNQATMERILAENNALRQEVAELRDKATITINVDAAEPFDASYALTHWSCKMNAALADEITCFDPIHEDQPVQIGRRLSKPWEQLSPVVTDCIIQNSTRFCWGDEISYADTSKHARLQLSQSLIEVWMLNIAILLLLANWMRRFKENGVSFSDLDTPKKADTSNVGATTNRFGLWAHSKRCANPLVIQNTDRDFKQILLYTQ